MILCPKCNDVVKLRAEPRTCACGASYGRYIDDVQAVYGGQAIPLGIANESLAWAVRCQPEAGKGERFDAFVIPKACPTMRRMDGSYRGA